MNSDQKIRVGMVLFPNLTQLDLTGPYQVLNVSTVAPCQIALAIFFPHPFFNFTALNPAVTSGTDCSMGKRSAEEPPT